MYVTHRRIGGHFTDNGTSENLHPGRADEASAVSTHISCTGFREVITLGILVRNLERRAVQDGCRQHRDIIGPQESAHGARTCKVAAHATGDTSEAM